MVRAMVVIVAAVAAPAVVIVLVVVVVGDRNVGGRHCDGSDSDSDSDIVDDEYDYDCGDGCDWPGGGENGCGLRPRQ